MRWAFSENEYFTDAVLEKRFWYRRARDGWSGLVSEPVNIQWKKDRDLTGGLLDLVCKAWEVEKKESKEKGKGLSPEQKALKKKIDNTGMGGLSFFAWFGFIGRKISAEESKEATELERERRGARKSGGVADGVCEWGYSGRGRGRGRAWHDFGDLPRWR